MLRAPGVLLLALLPLDGEWKVAVPDYAWDFPQDHWRHPGYRTEWLYFTGHLEATDGRRFGYQFTFFRIGVLPEPGESASSWSTSAIIMGHAAISDLREGRHDFAELLYRETPLLGGFNDYPDAPIAWTRGPVGTGERWQLDWNGEAFDFSMRDDAQDIGFELSTRPMKPLIFQGPGGFSRKGDGEDAASQYYSFTRLDTAGSLTVGGRSFDVTGTSWMDKEFSSSQLEENQVGWDWFSLQLNDGREVMLYLMRRADGTIDYQNGTIVSVDGEVRYLEGEAYRVTALDFWTSPETDARYPSRWRIEFSDLDLTLEVVSLLPDQENRSRLSGGVFYWEGACGVLDPSSGAEIGLGYVELTGYGEDNRPPV